MGDIEVTSLGDEARTEMAEATQPAFETHVRENLDAKAVELLEQLKAAVDAADESVYLN